MILNKSRKRLTGGRKCSYWRRSGSANRLPATGYGTPGTAGYSTKVSCLCGREVPHLNNWLLCPYNYRVYRAYQKGKFLEISWIWNYMGNRVSFALKSDDEWLPWMRVWWQYRIRTQMPVSLVPWALVREQPWVQIPEWGRYELCQAIKGD